MLRSGKDLVICSREKSRGCWSWPRKMISYGAALLGKVALIMRGYSNSNYDVLTGFFGAETGFWKREVFQSGRTGRFVPGGYKILLDFLKIAPRQTMIGEVHYAFDMRHQGKSKMNSKVCWEFIKTIFK
jgi:hypothetical protein